MRISTFRKEQKITFVKQNESLIREIYENNLGHNSALFVSLCKMAKERQVYSPITVNIQIYTNLKHICEKDIGWKFNQKTRL